MKSIWSEKSIIYFGRMEPDNNLIKYFNPQTTWLNAEDLETKEFEESLNRIYANGGDAWIETSSYKSLSLSEKGVEWLRIHGEQDQKYKLIDPAYDVIVIKIRPQS